MTLTNNQSSPATLGQLYATVLELFREAPARELLHEEIAERSGHSPAALRLRWPATADLLMDALVEACFPTPADPGDLGLREELVHFASHLTREHALHGDMVSALAARLPVDAALSRAHRRKVILPRNETARRILGRAVLRGEVGPQVETGLVFAIIPAYLSYRTILRDPLHDPGAAERLVDQVLLPLLLRRSPPP